MQATTYVDELFARFEQTPQLLDFKHEVLTNLLDRIEDLKSQGTSEAESVKLATAELADVTEIAEEMSLERRRDVIGDIYLQRKVRPTTGHLIAYIVLGALLVIGLGLLIPLALGGTTAAWLLAVIGIALIALPTGALTAAALTQETRTNLPMPRGRALAYGAGVALVLAGLAAGGAIILASPASWPAMLGLVLAGVILGGGLLVFLGVTQTNRHKPWVRQRAEQWAQEYAGAYENPEQWAAFGVATVACWIIAIGLFIAIGLWIGFQYSWLVFLFALGAQFILLAATMRTRAARAGKPGEEN